jgi:probable phosphoglycerate mutase
MTRDFQRPFTLPSGASEIVFVRHGSSSRVAPEGQIVTGDGQHDPPLTEDGHRQADAVAQRLGDLPVAGLFITPLRRTAQTAAPLGARLGHEPVIVPDLREVHLGDWEGQFSARVVGRDPLSKEIFAAERWDVIPNAEDMDAFSERVRRGMEQIVTTVGPDATAVAVVHGGVIAEACRQVTRSLAFAFLYAENGSITRLIRLAGGRWAMASFNDTAHLARPS